MKNLVLSFAVLLMTISIQARNNGIDRLFRFPDIHGEKVVFSYAGDLYLTTITGGVAKRLTSHNGYEMFAHFSPDGTQIAFTGQYDGNTEVFLIPAQGGEPKRLTYTATLNRDDVADRMGPNNIVMGWTPDGKNIIYRSRKQTFNDFIGQLFLVSVEGGMSTELPLSSGGFCSYSPNGEQLAFSKIFREFRTWKYYEGGMAPEIYIYNFKTKEVDQIIKNKAQDFMPMWIGDEIYFVSDRDRMANIFSYDLKTKELKKRTAFSDYDVKFPGYDKNSIIFEKGGFLYVLDVVNQQTKKIDILIENDFPWAKDRVIHAADYISKIDISPAANRLLVSARGEIYNVPVEMGVTYNLTNSSGAHDRQAAWSPDGLQYAYISDISGEYEIYVSDINMSSKPKQITKNSNDYIFSFQWSPDGKMIAWNNKKMELNITNITTGKTVLAVKSLTWEITDFTWSPDSRWIAFADDDGKGLNKIFVYSVDNQKIKPVTDGWYAASQPHFSHDGNYLFFTSSRHFNPIYSATEWNVAYSDMDNIYMINLSKSTPSPFALSDITDKKTEDTAKKSNVEMVKIDFDEIIDRHILLPTENGNYWNMNYIDGVLYYMFRKTGSDGMQFKSYNLKEKQEYTHGSRINFQPSNDRKKMLISQGKNKFQMVNIPKGATKLNIENSIDFSAMMTKVDIKAEWQQIYEEAWRQMRDFLYAPNLHGVDWNKMHDKYALLLPYVNHRNDLTYLIGELIGELNIGHAYINGGERPEPDRIQTGLLGAKISRSKNGNFRIDKILEGENYRNNAKSPLTEIGLNIKEGDFIIAINGVESSKYKDIYEALQGKANKLVSLTISSDVQGSNGRVVVIKPIADESELYYYSWVQENIRKVDSATQGQVGYIHIPDMGVGGLNEFMKYFYPQLHKKALIIDDRGNGGGNVSPMIIERLSREIIRANMARNQTLPAQTPRQMLVGPTILLINQFSASDGDLFPYAYKKHKLGTVVGMRSWGGVIGIRGSLPFIDGADLRKPEFGTYAADGSEWIIEGYGVDPDVEIDNNPAREYQGIDDQLNKAIELILEQLKDYQSVPTPPSYPIKN